MIAEEFIIPKWVKIEDGATDSFARFSVEPFERGYGTTVGNALRRVLLASLEGSAVTAIRIEGIQHEFSAVPGVQEDVTDVVLNLKRCQLRLNRQEPVIFSFTHKGEGEVTASAMFKDVGEVDVFNPDQVIFTATNKTTKIEMEVKVARGRGYVTAEHFELEHAPLGTIYLDASFSPVTKVNFLVEDARVGQRTDYDRLLLDVWTNGTIAPENALQEAADLLIQHLKIFTKQEVETGEESAISAREDPELMKVLSRPVEELELSVRAANCLKAANIRTIADLVVREEAEMLKFHNFGKKSLDEIRTVLGNLGLELGMKLSGVETTQTEPAEEDEEEAETVEDNAEE
jgi:DNA-directed RNA polymerase subunit alpha